MHNRLSAFKRVRLAYFTAVLCGSILHTTGCKIPGLRCAKPGAPVPAAYHWNNGIPFGPLTGEPTSSQGGDVRKALNQPDVHGTTPIEDAADQPPLSSRKRALKGLTHLTGFFKSQSREEDQPPAVVHEIEPVQAELGGQLQQTSPSALGDVRQAAAILPASGSSNDTPDATGPGLTGEGSVARGDSLQPDTICNSAQLPQAAFYNDPYLVALINTTLAGNQELKILAEEIRIASNEAYARSGDYRPFLSVGAGAELEKSGRHTRQGAVEEQLEVAPGTEFPDPLGDFRVGASASWEIDIWNRLKNSQRAAAMRYLASQEGRTYIVTRVVAEVADNYYQLLALDNRLLTLQQTIEIQERSLQVARAKKAAGRDTELAVQRFQAEVQKNVSERTLIQQEIVETENRINFLAGRYPQPIERINVDFFELNLNTLSAGVPSELLQNRADIREAEREIAAAGLDVQVARARFYPSLSLTAGLGWNAFSSGYLFRTPESLVYGLAGELVGPLINRRAIQAAYSSSNAAQLQAIYNYQQTVLEAHIEVVNQISKVENYRQSIEVKKQQLESLQTSVEVAGMLFQNARAEYVEVLLAQRELMEAKMLLIDVKQEQLAAVVSAYQALGGGGF